MNYFRIILRNIAKYTCVACIVASISYSSAKVYGGEVNSTQPDYCVPSLADLSTVYIDFTADAALPSQLVRSDYERIVESAIRIVDTSRQPIRVVSNPGTIQLAPAAIRLNIVYSTLTRNDFGIPPPTDYLVVWLEYIRKLHDDKDGMIRTSGPVFVPIVSATQTDKYAFFSASHGLIEEALCSILRYSFNKICVREKGIGDIKVVEAASKCVKSSDWLEGIDDNLIINKRRQN